jgi:hypothetical protein
MAHMPYAASGVPAYGVNPRRMGSHGVGMGPHGVGMGPHGVSMGPHGVGMGLAWGWHGVGMGLAWGWHGVSMGLAWGCGMGVTSNTGPVGPYWPANWRYCIRVSRLNQSIGSRLNQSIRPTPAVHTAPVLRAAPGPGPLDQMRRGRVGKKRRGHDARNLAHHQGSQATSFLGRMRATSAGSCDAGASGGEFGWAPLRLEEPGNLFTSITADTFLRYAYSLCSNK